MAAKCPRIGSTVIIRRRDRGVVRGRSRHRTGTMLVLNHRLDRIQAIECADLVKTGSALGSASMQDFIRDGEVALARLKAKQGKSKK